jgi:secretion/DNA translocation related TadE-like protein
VSEAGSGSILGLAVAGSIAAMVMLLLPLYIGLQIRASVAGAADAAALAGADVATGLAPGEPCDVAGRIGSANGALISRCDVDGLIVTVTAKATFLGMPLSASATAGPPGAVTN